MNNNLNLKPISELKKVNYQFDKGDDSKSLKHLLSNDEWASLEMKIDYTPKNIIFLDVDGVLNGYNHWNMLGWKIVKLINNKKLIRWYTTMADPFGIHERKVKRLAKIVKATNAKIVMSSSWRFGWWKTPYEYQYPDQKKLTDLLNKYNIEVIDITPKSSNGRRDVEIINWLSKNEFMVNKFVILDDERYDLECFVNSNLVQTSSVRKGQMIKGFAKENTGLKNKHVKQAIKILRG